MSQEMPMTGSGETETDLVGKTEQVNKMLRELEGMVNAEQHAALTEFFAEWAVLSAMRTTLQMQSKTDESGAATSELETEKGA